MRKRPIWKPALLLLGSALFAGIPFAMLWPTEPFVVVMLSLVFVLGALGLFLDGPFRWFEVLFMRRAGQGRTWVLLILPLIAVGMVVTYLLLPDASLEGFPFLTELGLGAVVLGLIYADRAALRNRLARRKTDRIRRPSPPRS